MPVPVNLPSGKVAPDYEAFEPRFHRFMLANAGLEALGTGYRWTEGPVWMGDWGALLFQDLPNNRTMRWIEGVGVSIYRAPSDYANGQTRDCEGRLVACSHHGRCLYRTERDGTVTRLVDRHAGKRLNAPNDIVTHPDGSLWFSDPLYGISNDYEGGRQESEQPPALYRFDPADGSIRVMADDFGGPNGLAFSPDFRRLYVAETGDQTRDNPDQFLRVFDVAGEGAETRLTGGGLFHKITPGYADGIAVDEDGFVWSSAADGVHCIDPGGTVLGRITVPARVANVAFGGIALNRLFICGGSTVYSIFLNRRGARLL
ncbi:SMP-30/gluconolactonase/LRE family protein [Acuticoccus sp. MNP-M23]|uniref:SMP-30/gluconolactonase/LRE family protein n=1 Tax=Acuticoccus sp. MNP-M23 TaxID=3072793 RepID=UPI002815C6B8|nr:SMP-30/gluconolactonase/LRE family protein [Acuticoccus sp. MNP-M23]WMS41929.1 SMP-30/gluconolactonase/LRE family protein [Acuticoccus sp. MNP-M23]